MKGGPSAAGTPPFVHLHIHSIYSALRGVATIEELCRITAAQGFRMLALTDTNGLYGIPRFMRAAREYGLRPIAGAELSHGGHRAVALVKTPQGYEHLCRLLSSLHCDPDFDLLTAVAACRTGLVVLSDDETALAAWRRDSTADLYVETTPGPTLAAAVQLCRATGLPPVASNRVTLPSPNAYDAHRLLRAIALRSTLSAVPRAACCHPHHALIDPQGFAAHLAVMPEALTNTRIIAEACADTMPRVGPAAAEAGAGTMQDVLRAKAYAGARRRYGALNAAVQNRLEHELTVIGRRTLAPYFLIAEEVARRASQTSGRGSAAASIVAYCLGITHVDPLRHGLLFERFVSPERREPPDIDIDVPWDERDELLEWLIAAHAGRAAMVAAQHFLGLRGAFLEVARVFGLGRAEIAAISRLAARYFSLAELAGNARADHLAAAVHAELRSTRPADTILGWAVRLQTAFRGLAVHCGGVVVAPGDLRRCVPIEIAAKGVPVIQWDKDDVEAAGLFKLDILGNRSLAVVRDTQAATGRPVPEHAAVDDPAARELICRGDTVGCFHVESPATRQLLRKFWNTTAANGPDTGRTAPPSRDFAEDLTIVSALIRPAAISFAPTVIRRAQAKRNDMDCAPTCGRPPVLLERLLPETYGVLVFQEDVMRIAMALGDMTPAEADGVRRAVSMKAGYRDLATFRDRIVAGALAYGADAAEAAELWRMVKSFTGYSFCKAHAASYAELAMRCAFLRAHFPAAFMAAVLTNEGGYYEPLAYVLEARRMGLTIRPPDINRSGWGCAAENGGIRLGFGRLRGMHMALAMSIVRQREAAGPFTSLRSFLARLQPSPEQSRRLVLSGALDSIADGLTRPALMWRLHAWRNRADADGMPMPPEYDDETRLRHEIELFGFPLSRHPLDLYAGALALVPRVEGRDMGAHVGRRVTMAGWPIMDKLTHTRHGDPMAFLSFDDGTALYETTFFPDVYQRHAAQIGAPLPHVLDGIVEEDSGALSLRVTSMRLVRRPSPERRSAVMAG
jgi:error-prone DNA polymerase